jgi:hypothetical protein
MVAFMDFSAATARLVPSLRLAVRLHKAPSETLMAFDSLLPFTRVQEFTFSRRSKMSSPNLVLEGRTGDAYEEQAFRHFLLLERDRASAGGRKCLLLLVSLRRDPDQGTREMSRQIGSSVLTGLEESIREVDFIGWYRDRHVAGAVLTQGLDTPGDQMRSAIADRVKRTLSRRLPGDVASRLRVRVLPLGKASNS